MQSRGVFIISCFKWKNPREGFKLKKKNRGGFCSWEGFSNCYTGPSWNGVMVTSWCWGSEQSQSYRLSDFSESRCS